MGFNVTFIIWGIIFLIGAIGCAIGFIWSKKDEYADAPPFIIGLSIGLMTLAFIVIVVISGCRFTFRHEEPLQYAELVAEHDSLVASLHTTIDIVNTDLYLRIADYNMKVAKMAAAYNDPGYSWSFSGNYDWSAIPLINASRYNTIAVL